ncbi:hypothetical protein AVEN_156329-1 [Araneus ventricosus]|uniref:DNA-directed DNA polymerase n=1 Tax=Araneus ventricosus TaxID=182803 RepID=A0A4Y2L585_ARAVE|nr:hypothetical protein AVEN_156329-1 [Araneus ventricosus]
MQGVLYVAFFSPKQKGHTVIAHNMKGFDGQFIVGWMLEQGTSPSVIPIGSKLMSILHPSLGITIIDSMSFLPMCLSKLPNCFGLSELKKGYFPHLFNVRENQNYVGPLPSSNFTLQIACPLLHEQHSCPGMLIM